MAGSSRASESRRPTPLPAWVVALIFVAILAVSLWKTNEPARPGPQDAGNGSLPVITDHDSHKPVDPADRPFDIQITPESDSEPSRSRSQQPAKFEKQVIRDQEGQVAYEGPIDLQPTLDRIAQGKRAAHRNDGSVFQNRERRLPARPGGYYKEYVHPTPNLSGPGPQRVIIGQEGDVWYTPDHYRTFLRIK